MMQQTVYICGPIMVQGWRVFNLRFKSLRGGEMIFFFSKYAIFPQTVDNSGFHFKIIFFLQQTLYTCLLVAIISCIFG